MTPSLRRDAASGLIVLVPLLVTAYTVFWLFELVAGVQIVGVVAPHIPVLADLDPALARATLIVAILIGTLAVVSWIMRTALGAYFETRLDASVNQVPGFRVVYNASKIAMETALGEEVEVSSPTRVHLWDGARLTGFRTGRETRDGRVTIFVPASPVIFTGLLIELDEDRISDTGESPEDALIRVISAGFADRSDSPGTAPAAAATPAGVAAAGRAMRDDEEGRDHEGGRDHEADGNHEADADRGGN